MKMIRFYEYPQCSTCRDAFKFLTNNRFAVERIDIFKTPPTKEELKQMLKYQGGNISSLFNSLGHVFSEMGLKEKLPKMTEEEALELLSKNGKLVKRPFVLFENQGLVGYKKEVWKKELKL